MRQIDRECDAVLGCSIEECLPGEDAAYLEVRREWAHEFQPKRVEIDGHVIESKTRLHGNAAINGDSAGAARWIVERERCIDVHQARERTVEHDRAGHRRARRDVVYVAPEQVET